MNKKYLVPSILFLVSLFGLICYSFVLINNENWFLHPDDKEIWKVTSDLIESGEFKVYNPLNKVIEFPLFIPEGSTYYDGFIVPTRTPLNFLIYLPLQYLKFNLIFLVNSILSVLTGIIFYLFIRKLSNDEKISIIATIIFMISFQIIYWSNFLFSNIITLGLFIFGLYYSIGDKRNLILSSIFFTISGLLRIEYFLYIFLFLMIYLIFKRDKFYIKSLIIIIILCSPLLIYNNNIYGNPLEIGYTSGYDIKTKTITGQSTESNSLQERIINLYLRFSGQFRDFDLSTFITNSKSYFGLFPIFIFMITFLGIIFCNKIDKSFRVYSFILLVFLLLYFNSGSYGSFSSNGISSSYTRYHLTTLFILAIFSSSFIILLISKSNKFGAVLIISLFVLIYLISAITIAFISPVGLINTLDILSDYKQINEYANNLPTDSIILSDLYSKIIIDKETFRYYSISKNEDGIEILSNSIKTLIQSNYSIYLMQNTRHNSTYIQINILEKNNLDVNCSFPITSLSNVEVCSITSTNSNSRSQT